MSRRPRCSQRCGQKGRLEREADGYRLVVRPGECDADHFEQLWSDAREAPEATEALALIDRALRCWKGQAYDEFARPERLAFFLAVLPITTVALLCRRYRASAVAAAIL